MSARTAAARVWVGLWIVYVVWGSTYLAIRLMVRTIPPLVGGGVRFLVAGTLMCGFLVVRRGTRALRLSKRQLAATALVGALLPAGGNGLVNVAERHLPSGVAALIISSVPLWVVLYRFLDRQRMRPAMLAGVAFGFGGVALLLLPAGRPSGVHAVGVALCLLAALSWSAGSFLSPGLPVPADPFVAVAVEMVFGGLILLVASAATGEHVHPAGFSAESIGGLAYLVVIGSLLAYSAYGWLLENAPISKVSTYAYVNPVIAVFLGWAVLSEQVTPLTLLGAAVIVASVAATVRHEAEQAAPRRRPAVDAPAGFSARPQESRRS